jgi:methyl-accepting chemotaxis protein
MIEFTPKGDILGANEGFLKVMGYSLGEVVGRHHRMFVDPAYAASEEYADFWRRLEAGEFQVAEFRRFARGGREVWIHGSYNPVRDAQGRVQRVVKIATDITEQSAANADAQPGRGHSTLAGRHRVHPRRRRARRERQLPEGDGLPPRGGAGRHHRMFVDESATRRRGVPRVLGQAAARRGARGEYRRLGKGGKEVWIQATYNPIFDRANRRSKVVKFALDVTDVSAPCATASTARSTRSRA